MATPPLASVPTISMTEADGADAQLGAMSPELLPSSPTPPSTPTTSNSGSSSGISLRAVVTLGQALIKGDSNIHSLLQTLAEKGKTRHDDRKKRKRSKKEKKETPGGGEGGSSKSSTWSATSLAAATAEAKAAELAAKKTHPKRKRSVSDARMIASDDALVVHRDRSRSAPSDIAPLPAVRSSAPPLPSGTPRHKDAIVRSHSASSSSGLLRDLSAKPKKVSSTGTSPTVHHLHHHHHSSSAIPTTATIKKSPRMRGRSSSVCGSSSSSPIRRAAPASAAASHAPTSVHSALTPATAALLSPRVERLPLPPAEGLCAHGRPLHHQQSRSSLLMPGHHHTCRHARSVPTSVEFDAIPTVPSPSLTAPGAQTVPVESTNARGNNQWAMGDAELEYLLSTIEESATSASLPTFSPGFLTATMTDSTRTSPVAQSATTMPERRPSFDMMHIADTMQRVSIDCKDDDFDPMRFLDMELATATAAVAAASAQQPLTAPTPSHQHAALHQSFNSFRPSERYHGHALHQHQQPQSMHMSAPQGVSTLTRSMSQPAQTFHPPAPVPPASGDAYARQTRCNSDVGFFSSLLLKEDEQQMRELYMAIDDASIPFDLSYFDATN